VAFERYGVKQATKPPTSTDRYRFRLSGTLAVAILGWRGASARTITRFQMYGGEQLEMLASRWNY